MLIETAITIPSFPMLVVNIEWELAKATSQVAKAQLRRGTFHAPNLIELNTALILRTCAVPKQEDAAELN